MGAARASRRCATLPELSRRRERSSRVAGLGVALDDRSRHGLAPRRLAAGHRRHALRRLRPAAGLDHLHPAEPLPRHPRGEARVPEEPRRARSRSTCARRPASRCRSRRSCTCAPTPRRSPSTTRGSSRRSRISFNVAPGVVARRGRRRDPRAPRREIGAAAQRPRRLPGHGAGVPRVAGERAGAHPRRAHHRLHRARRALRELHPPDHDPVDAALGRRRRAARADGLPAPSSASSRSSGSSCSSAS